MSWGPRCWKKSNQNNVIEMKMRHRKLSHPAVEWQRQAASFLLAVFSPGLSFINSDEGVWLEDYRVRPCGTQWIGLWTQIMETEKSVPISYHNREKFCFSWSGVEPGCPILTSIPSLFPDLTGKGMPLEWLRIGTGQNLKLCLLLLAP